MVTDYILFLTLLILIGLSGCIPESYERVNTPSNALYIEGIVDPTLGCRLTLSRLIPLDSTIERGTQIDLVTADFVGLVQEGGDTL